MVVSFINFQVENKVSTCRGGDSHIKVTGVIVGNFEKNP